MRRPIPPRTVVYAVLALAMVAPVAACGDEPVFPLDADPPRTSVTASVPAPSPTTRGPTLRAATPRRTQTRTPSPTASPACAVVFKVVKADDQLALLRPGFCTATGGVLRIEAMGPDGVTLEPSGIASTACDVGICEVFFANPGTVNVSIVRGTDFVEIPVVVR